VVAPAAAALSIGLACGASAPQRDTKKPEPSLEYKLAVVQRGGYVAEDDPLVMRFGRALDRLVSKCPETRQQLADMGVKGRQILSEKHIDEALVDILENWRAAIPDDAQKGQVGPCADVLAAYVVLRVGR
jgi:hypothetical protein